MWLIAIVAIGLAAYALLLHQAYTWQGNTHPDFYIEWLASRIALEGGNPYSDETTASIQMGSKGHPVAAGEDQLAFVYPFYRVFVNLPVAFLPYDWATAIWQTAMQASLLASVVLFVRALGWQASPGELALVLLVAVLAYPTFGGMVLGQMAVGVLALLLVAFWALRRGHDGLAGACLALATVKPQLAILAVPALLGWSLVCRRGRVLLAFAVTLGLLISASFVLFPPWLAEFVRTAGRYPSYKNVQTGPGYLLSACCGAVWPWVLMVAAALWLLAAWGLALWARSQAGARPGGRFQARRWLDGAFVLTLALSSFLLPQTSIVNHLLLLPAVLLVLRDLASWAARFALAAASIGGSWLAFVYLYDAHYALNMALPPLVMLLALAAWYAAERWRNGKKPE